ncbi:hypothetical protein PR048_002274 [Dryococelus australis]|uniref:Uncharacterized protein n=1 Tax=Dryococelus australis TaxID=614101 RepID=A0ABQ9IJR5_9NEOP|nr:hypothetical protein PR048_002274 [Dryococelus australis]
MKLLLHWWLYVSAPFPGYLGQSFEKDGCSPAQLVHFGGVEWEMRHSLCWPPKGFISRISWSGKSSILQFVFKSDTYVARPLASRPGSIPDGVTPVFPHVRIVPDDAAVRRVFSGISGPSPRTAPEFRRCSMLASLHPLSALKTSLLRAAQISPLLSTPTVNVVALFTGQRDYASGEEPPTRQFGEFGKWCVLQGPATITMPPCPLSSLTSRDSLIICCYNRSPKLPQQTRGQGKNEEKKLKTDESAEDRGQAGTWLMTSHDHVGQSVLATSERTVGRGHGNCSRALSDSTVFTALLTMCMRTLHFLSVKRKMANLTQRGAAVAAAKLVWRLPHTLATRLAPVFHSRSDGCAKSLGSQGRLCTPATTEAGPFPVCTYPVPYRALHRILLPALLTRLRAKQRLKERELHAKEAGIAAVRDWVDMASVWGHHYLPKCTYSCTMVKKGEGKTRIDTRCEENTARLARRSDETLGVRISVVRIAPSLLDLERAAT